MVALGDYGAVKCALSVQQFERVLKTFTNLSYETLQEPASLSPAIRSSPKDTTSFTTSRTVKLSVTIMLYTNLPIRIHQIPFLVVVV